LQRTTFFANIVLRDFNSSSSPPKFRTKAGAVFQTVPAFFWCLLGG